MVNTTCDADCDTQWVGDTCLSLWVCIVTVTSLCTQCDDGVYVSM